MKPAVDPVARYELKELADRAGVTPRTVHFYIQQGLLPPAGQPGPGARYSEAHLARLVLVRRLQRQHLPLAEIRQRLQGLDDDAVRELVEQASRSPTGAASRETSALEYIRGVLGQSSAESGPMAARARVAASPASKLVASAAPAASAAAPPPGLQRGSAASASFVPDRSQWDRIALAQDIELHIRRPLTRQQNRSVERLIAAAKEILNQEEP